MGVLIVSIVFFVAGLILALIAGRSNRQAKDAWRAGAEVKETLEAQIAATDAKLSRDVRAVFDRVRQTPTRESCARCAGKGYYDEVELDLRTGKTKTVNAVCPCIPINERDRLRLIAEVGNELEKR